ncbi:YraN family protein [candidate division WOR-3 bacterium]|nr:YraN family protein [candidate division WOR-3 bacterium]
MKSRKEKGNIGEDQASLYLKKRGFSIIDKNFTSYFGEIDIIAMKNNTLVFFEVRTKHSSKKGNPAESITIYKKRKIFKTAQFYIKIHPELSMNKIRFDFIGIKYSDNNTQFNHIENIISEDELY